MEKQTLSRSRFKKAITLVKDAINRYDTYPVRLHIDVTGTRFESLFKSFELPGNLKIIKLQYDHREKSWFTWGPVTFVQNRIVMEPKGKSYQRKPLSYAFVSEAERQREEKKKVITLTMHVSQLVGLFLE